MSERTLTQADLEAIREIVYSAVAGQARAAAPAPAARASGAVFKFGRSKGQPLAGASAGDLAWYAEAISRSIDDPAKSRWRADNIAHLAEVEEAMNGGALRTGGGQAPAAPPGEEFADAQDEIPFITCEGRR